MSRLQRHYTYKKKILSIFLICDIIFQDALYTFNLFVLFLLKFFIQMLNEGFRKFSSMLSFMLKLHSGNSGISKQEKREIYLFVLNQDCLLPLKAANSKLWIV